MTKVWGALALWSSHPYPCYSGIDCLPPKTLQNP